MMSESLRELLEWNHRVVLGDLLAIEKHLVYGGPSWCILKHKIHALEHGVSEAISHSERLGLDSSRYREFYKKLEALPESPSIEDVVKLRNEWASIAGYVEEEGCPICRLDISGEILKKIREVERRLEEAEQPSRGSTDTGRIALVALAAAAFLAVLYFTAKPR